VSGHPLELTSRPFTSISRELSPNFPMPVLSIEWSKSDLHLSTPPPLPEERLDFLHTCDFYSRKTQNTIALNIHYNWTPCRRFQFPTPPSLQIAAVPPPPDGLPSFLRVRTKSSPFSKRQEPPELESFVKRNRAAALSSFPCYSQSSDPPPQSIKGKNQELKKRTGDYFGTLCIFPP